MTTRPWIRQLFARPATRPIRKRPARARLALEALEDRCVPTTFIVLNTNDSGSGSLRDAIAQAQSGLNAGVADTIVFGDGSASGGTNFLDSTPDTITLTTGQLTLTDTTTISGPGAGLLSISGNNASRVFLVTAGTVSISGLTITQGSAASGGGMELTGGIVSLTGCVLTGNQATSVHGGAIAASGATLTLTGCTVSYNTAPQHGGGIDSPGMILTITDSTFTGNSADEGGALSIGTGTVNIVNSTISGNSATSFGGGINSNFAATFNVFSSTIANNNSNTGTGGGVRRLGGVFNVTNTIIAGNTAGAAPDISGAVASGGHNLVGNTSGASGFALTDLLNVNPLLGPLTNNGGPTLTHALAAGSPALDAGSTALTTDQRGLSRPRGIAADIGAFEAPPANTPPRDITLEATPGVVAEGAPLKILGTFTDLEAGEKHFVDIFWGDGSEVETIPLDAGDFSFSADHYYRGPLDPGSGLAKRDVIVQVRDDAGLSASADVSVWVVNAAPEVVAGGDEFLNVGQVFTRAGSFTDSEEEPGEGEQYGTPFVSYTAMVDYGDGTGLQSLALTADNRFTLSHVYQEEGSFVVVVYVTDSRGATGAAAFNADVLLAGVPTLPADKETAAPGQTVTATTTGISATLFHHASSRGNASIIVAIVPATVAGSLDSAYTGANPDVITAAYDIRVVNGGPADRLVVTLQYANDDFDVPTVSFFNRTTRQQQLVPPHLFVVNRFTRTVTLFLDATTSPRLQDLTGTVFTISVPINVAPPFDPTALTALLNLRRGEARAEIASVLVGTTLVGTNTASQSQLAPAAEEGFTGTASEGESEPAVESARAGESAAVASELPPRPAGLIGLQAATATASLPDNMPTWRSSEADSQSGESLPEDASGQGPDTSEEEEEQEAPLDTASLTPEDDRDALFATLGPAGLGVPELLLLAAALLHLPPRRHDDCSHRSR